MRKVQIVGAFVAVVAFCIIAVASAGATLWLNAKKESLTKATAAEWHATWILVHKEGTLGNAEVECSMTLHGTVGPGAEDTIESILPLSSGEANLITCKPVSGTCGSTTVVHAVGLPWDTKLLLHEDGSTWDMILKDGWLWLCLFGVTVECKGEIEEKFLGNGASGAEFLLEGGESGEQVCTDGGKGSIRDTAAGVALGFTVS